MIRRLMAGAGALTAALLLGAPAVAQIDEGWGAAAGVTAEQYLFLEETGLESLVLLTLPIGAEYALPAGLDLGVQAAWARGELTRAGGETLALSGLRDTRIRLGWTAPGDAVRVELVGYAPTGVATHDEDEAVVAGVVSADLLPLQTSHWGTGGGIATNVSAAYELGGIGLGAALSYRVSGEFEPIQPVDGNEFRYRPGSELMLRAAADVAVGDRSKLSVRLGVRQFSEDVGNQVNLFQSGDRVEALVTYSFPVRLRSAGAVYGSLIRRQQGRFLIEDGGEVPAQNLALLGGLVRLPFLGGFAIPRLDARYYQPGGAGGGGFVVGAGGSLELPLGSSFSLVPSAKGRIGILDLAAGDRSGFTGWQAGLMARYQPER